jgi:ADP-heptose:LPS heptosyltransferase
MGNFVVSLPAINALKNYFTKKNFYLAVDSAYREIAETIDGLDNLILYPRKQIRNSALIERTGLFLKFVRQLRSISPDLIVDLEGRQVSSTLAFLAGASMRVGSATAHKPYFYNLKVDLSGGEKHRIYRYIEIAHAVGAECENKYQHLRAGYSQRASLEYKFIDQGAAKDRPVVCIHPGARIAFKEWSSKGFIEISDWLISKGFQVVFVGGNSDLDKIKEIAPLLKGPSYNLAGKLSLGELIALFEISSLYIGNDSGPMHVASAVGTLPVIGLFFKKSIILKGDAGCQKCKERHCEHDLECIKKLSPGEVKAAVEKLIYDKENIHEQEA